VKWWILAAGVAANAAASILVKVAVSPPRRLFTPNDPLATLSNFPLLLGVVLYGLAFVLYALALTRLPLNVAHPILTAGAIATVATCSVALLGEPARPALVAGIVLVIAGVVLITRAGGS
jgi:small multidrug resistance pump